MIEVIRLGLLLIQVLCSIQGQSFKIFTKFINGNLIFTWSNISTTQNDIAITKDSLESPWISVYEDKYTVEDVTLYKTVTIRIREFNTKQNFVDYNMTFNDGPRNITIIPPLPNDGLSVHDGVTFGPYTCSADCNPPCSVQWKLRDPSGGFRDATSIGTSSVTMPVQTANKTNMASTRCIVSSTEGIETSSIKLNILYLLHPSVYINGKPSNALTINETNQVFLSCFVDGNPIPKVTLRKLTGNQIYIQNVTHWLNYTLIRSAQCSDTGTFECVGQSTEFERRNQDFSINVLCEPRLDEGTLVKNIYESRSGLDVKVVVSLPVVANPLTSTSGFVWLGPTFASISMKVSQRDNVVYKHWINSSIPVPDQKSFGTYSLKYKGKVFADIQIHAKDVSAVSRETSDQTAWVVVGVLIGLFVLLLMSFGVYKFTFHRDIRTGSIQQPQPAHDLNIQNKEYDDIGNVNVEAQDQSPNTQTYEDVTENTEQIHPLTDYQNISGHQDNQYEELDFTRL